MNPHQALDAYFSLTMTTDRCRRFAIRHHPCRVRARLSDRTLSARTMLHEPMTVLICSHTLTLLVMVTPRIFIVVVRSMPGIGGGGCMRDVRLSAFMEVNDFGVFRRIYLHIVGPCPCLAVGQPCLSTAGVYGWNDNVRTVSERFGMLSTFCLQTAEIGGHPKAGRLANTAANCTLLVPQISRSPALSFRTRYCTYRSESLVTVCGDVCHTPESLLVSSPELAHLRTIYFALYKYIHYIIILYIVANKNLCMHMKE